MKRYGSGPLSSASSGLFFGGAKMNSQDQLSEQLLSKERQVMRFKASFCLYLRLSLEERILLKSLEI